LTAVPKPAGKYVAIPGGRAFVPDPLPPKLAWSPELVKAAIDAGHVLGRLAGEGGRLPNPHLLIRPFVRREAVLSSKIEGTQATLGQLLADEAGALAERVPDDLNEVRNYVVALEQGVARLGKLPLSLRLMKELHHTLMKGVRGDSAAPGEFRRIQNWIGPAGATVANARFVPPPPNELAACLDAWEKHLHDDDLPPLLHAALLHYQFEAIHPFIDGNGRVGRLLITLFLVEREILPAPLLYLSAFFEATRRDYYDLLTRVSQRGEWQPWVLYFLRGAAHQGKDALDRVARINALREQWRRRLASRQTRKVMELLDRITANPFITVKGASGELGIAFTTAQRAIDALLDHKILVQVNDARRGRVYVAKALLDILDEPADVIQAEKADEKKRKRR
jgi:Fic family protein